MQRMNLTYNPTCDIVETPLARCGTQRAPNAAIAPDSVVRSYAQRVRKLRACSSGTRSACAELEPLAGTASCYDWLRRHAGSAEQHRDRPRTSSSVAIFRNLNHR